VYTTKEERAKEIKSTQKEEQMKLQTGKEHQKSKKSNLFLPSFNQHLY